MAQLYVTFPGPSNTRSLYSWLATSLRSLAIILPYLPLYYSTILTSTCATVSTDITSYEAILGTLLSLLQFQIRFAYRISWITPFRRVTTRSLRTTYLTDLRPLIALAKCLDMSIELRLTVTETILCGIQRPIGERRVATPTNEKSYGLEIYELQIQKRYESSTQSRLTVVQKIRVDTRGQPARRRVSQQVGRSQLQWIHTRTRWLPIAASIIFNKLPSNWVNWRLQGRFHGPYAIESCVTRNAEAGPTSVRSWW